MEVTGSDGVSNNEQSSGPDQSVAYGVSRSMLKGGMNAGGMPVEENIQPTMTSNGCGAVCYAIENHPNDSRVTVDPNGIVQTLSSRMGTGGNNTPFVLIENDPSVISLEGNGARPSHLGTGWSQDGKMFTLNTIEKHAVCYETGKDEGEE